MSTQHNIGYNTTASGTF